MSRTVARLLAESLEAHEVDQVYCVPGESYVGLTSALIERNSIRVIVCRHEGGAGYMAVADGRLRDRAGVAMVSRGPGLSNAMVSLHSAYHDATPVVMLVGQVERKDFGRLALQEQNYSRLLSDVTKLVIEVNEPEQASEAIARAFHVAESGTPGPVAVILPEDIFDEETEAELESGAAARRRGPARRGSRPAGRDARPSRAAAGAGRRRAIGRRCPRQRRLRRSQPVRRRMDVADQPDPSPAAIVRRDPSEFRRLYGNPRAAGADRRDEARRSDGHSGRAYDRHGQPVLQLSDRTAAAVAVRPCLAGPQRSGPRLATRSRHSVQSIRGHQSAAAAWRSGRCREAPRLGRWTACDPSQAAGQGMGTDQRRREFCRDRLRGRQTPVARRDSHDRRRQFR